MYKGDYGWYIPSLHTLYQKFKKQWRDSFIELLLFSKLILQQLCRLLILPFPKFSETSHSCFEMMRLYCICFLLVLTKRKTYRRCYSICKKKKKFSIALSHSTYSVVFIQNHREFNYFLSKDFNIYTNHCKHLAENMEWIYILKVSEQ